VRLAGVVPRDTALVCTSTTARILVVDRAMQATIQKKHADIERLLMRGFLTRAAAEYRHWIRHQSIESVVGVDHAMCRREPGQRM